MAILYSPNTLNNTFSVCLLFAFRRKNMCFNIMITSHFQIEINKLRDHILLTCKYWYNSDCTLHVDLYKCWIIFAILSRNQQDLNWESSNRVGTLSHFAILPKYWICNWSFLLFIKEHCISKYELKSVAFLKKFVTNLSSPNKIGRKYFFLFKKCLNRGNLLTITSFYHLCIIYNFVLNKMLLRSLIPLGEGLINLLPELVIIIYLLNSQLTIYLLSNFTYSQIKLIQYRVWLIFLKHCCENFLSLILGK